MLINLLFSHTKFPPLNMAVNLKASQVKVSTAVPTPPILDPPPLEVSTPQVDSTQDSTLAMVLTAAVLHSLVGLKAKYFNIVLSAWSFYFVS